MIRDELVGYGEVNLRPLMESGEKHQDTVVELTRTVKGKEEPAGGVKVAFTLSGRRFVRGDESQSHQTLQTRAEKVDILKGQPFVEIKVHSVADLYNTELLGKMDPYLKYELGNNKIETDYKRNGGPTCDLNFTSTMPYNNEPTLRYVPIFCILHFFLDLKFGIMIVQARTILLDMARLTSTHSKPEL